MISLNSSLYLAAEKIWEVKKFEPALMVEPYCTQFHEKVFPFTIFTFCHELQVMLFVFLLLFFVFFLNKAVLNYGIERK